MMHIIPMVKLSISTLLVDGFIVFDFCVKKVFSVKHLINPCPLAVAKTRHQWLTLVPSSSGKEMSGVARLSIWRVTK